MTNCTSVLCLLNPCSPLQAGQRSFRDFALQAPFRPTGCKAHLVYASRHHSGPPSSTLRLSPLGAASSSLHLRRWSFKKPCLHICNANDEENNGKGDTLLLETLSRIFNSSFHFLRTNFLPSILVSGVLLGVAYPKLGQQVFHIGLSKWATFGVFLISGLTLRTSELSDALEAWPSLLFGVVTVLFLTPWVAVLVLQIHLVPQELVTGLALFCCVPTTLSSGVSLTQVAGANTALALSLTLLSNLLGILTMPFMISKLVARGLGISIPAGPLMKSLVETLVVPLFLGKVIRTCIPGFKGVLDKRKEEFSFLSAICLALVPWMQVSCARDLLLTLKLWTFAAAAALGMTIHFVFLLWNIIGMQALQSFVESNDHRQKSTAWAIILTASQKTLPITIAVIGGLGGLMGEAGLLVLPCLTAHITQIVFDSFLVRLWIQGDLRRSRSTDQ